MSYLFFQKLKSQMAIVKAEKSLKTEWGKCRRQIKPKIGQLTDDQTAIDRIVSIYTYSRSFITQKLPHSLGKFWKSSILQQVPINFKSTLLSSLLLPRISSFKPKSKQQPKSSLQDPSPTWPSISFQPYQIFQWSSLRSSFSVLAAGQYLFRYQTMTTTDANGPI